MTTSGSATSMAYDPFNLDQWRTMMGTWQGLANNLINNPTYPGNQVAPPTDLMNNYWNTATGLGQVGAAPDMSGFQRGMTDAGGAMVNQYVDPNQINFNSNFNFAPGGLNFNNPFANGTPNVSAPGGVSGSAGSYQVNPMMVNGPSVQAQMVQAPGAINPITGLMQVSGPNLQNYQMGQAQNVYAPNLQNFTMHAANPPVMESNALHFSSIEPL